MLEEFEGAEAGGGAGFDAECGEDLFHVFFDGFLADAEDGGDFGVGFALDDPEEDLGFTGAESEDEEGLGSAEIGGESGAMGLSGAVESGGDGGDEFVVIDGFGEVIVGAEVHAGAEVGAVGFGGEEDEGDGLPGGFETDAAEEFVSVHFGHHDIAEDELRGLLAEGFEGVPAVGNAAGLEAFELEQADEVAAHFGFVLDDQDGGRVHGWEGLRWE